MRERASLCLGNNGSMEQRSNYGGFVASAGRPSGSRPSGSDPNSFNLKGHHPPRLAALRERGHRLAARMSRKSSDPSKDPASRREVVAAGTLIALGLPRDATTGRLIERLCGGARSSRRAGDAAARSNGCRRRSRRGVAQPVAGSRRFGKAMSFVPAPSLTEPFQRSEPASRSIKHLPHR